MSARPAIAAAALGLVGSPFRHQGRTPSLGLDCLGVLVCAGRAAGLPCAEPVARYRAHPDPADREHYTPYLRPLMGGEAPEPGDAVLLGVDGRATHGGVLVEGDRLVHAVAVGARRVVVESLAGVRWPILGAYRYRE